MILTDNDLLNARLGARVRNKLFAHRMSPEGVRVAVRRNLNCSVKGISVQTIHRKSPTGRALGYGAAVTVRNASFMVDQIGRADIASGRTSKRPMAAVIGDLTHDTPRLEGVEIRFNPKTSHLFVRADDGRAVQTADEVTIYNTRAFARGNITYWTAETAPQPLEGIVSDARFG